MHQSEQHRVASQEGRIHLSMGNIKPHSRLQTMYSSWQVASHRFQACACRQITVDVTHSYLASSGSVPEVIPEGVHIAGLRQRERVLQTRRHLDHSLPA